MNTKLVVEKMETHNRTFTYISIPKIQNYRVYKHNDLVECKSDFSAMEHRIIVLALAQITAHDETLKMYRINIRDVLGKNNSSNYALVRNAVKKLHKSTIDMEDGKKWKSYSFITKAQGEYGTNFIEIQFHEDIQKFLLGLKSQYTSYTLHNVINFKRNYSLRIYELCKQYQRIGNRTMSLKFLRTLLFLEAKYENFRDFKRFVIQSAVEEINKYSDIEVSFKAIREGRKVESIKFFMSKKQGVTDSEGQTLEELGVDSDNQKKLESLGFHRDDCSNLRAKYGSEKLTKVLGLFEKNIDEVKFPKPWIEHVLEQGYVDATDYKRKLSEKDDLSKLTIEKLKAKNRKKSEIAILKEGIHYMQFDLDTYRKTGSLKPGDVMRFPEKFTVDDAIATMEQRIEEGLVFIEEKTRDLDVIEKELDKIV